LWGIIIVTEKMEIIKHYSGPEVSLVYLAKPIYGGWVTYTAHLSKRMGTNIYKVSKRSEKSKRNYGYGCEYQNMEISDIVKLPNIYITAIDKHHWSILRHFPKDTKIVIHDPTEVKLSKSGNPLIQKSDMGEYLLRELRVITIRETVQKYLRERHSISSVFEYHPFYEYPKMNQGMGYECVSIARIDFDKNTDIILGANQIINDPKKRIRLFGAENRLYVFHKLGELDFDKYWMGKFDKTFEPSQENKSILKDAKYMIDMSTIKGDGGGTQYTFLEAIHNDCVLILHEDWINKGDTFISGVNCVGVSGKESLARFLEEGMDEHKYRKIKRKSKDILKKHVG
jgi:hypothetical protein